eukprot:scaffold8.g1442.t1
MEDDHDEGLVDEEMDDADLQLALMLSMQQEQPGQGAPAQAAAPAPAPAAPVPAPPQAAGPAPQVNALSLQQALQQALLQAAMGGVHAPAAQQPPPPQQQQQAAAAAAPLPAPAPSRPPTAPAPAWLKAAVAWAPAAPADEAGVVVPAAAAPALEAAASMVLGQPVALVGGAGVAPRPGTRRLAKKANAALAADEDDLFFEGGRSRGAFLLALEGGQVSPAFIEALASAAAGPAEAALWEGILRDAFAALRQFSFLHADKAEGPLRRLDLLTQAPSLKRCLAAVLAREAGAAGGESPRGRRPTGAAFEAAAAAGPLLAVGCLPGVPPSLLPLAFPAKECFMQLRSYPHNRGAQVDAEYNSIRRSLQRAYAAAHEICKRVASLKGGPAEAAARGREVVPAWLAASLGSSAVRAEAGSYLERVLHHRKALTEGASDCFMVGVTAVLLRFCRPFLASPDKQRGALQHLHPSYYARHRHRLAATTGGAGERALATGAPPPPPPGGGPEPFPYLSPDGADAPHFVADCFFLTQRAVRVALLPATYRHQALAKLLARQTGEEDDEAPVGELAAASVEQWVLHDSMTAQLLDPEFAADSVAFVELQARWLLWAMGLGEAEALAAFSAVPEALLGGMDIATLVACLTALLRRTDLVPSPAVAFSIVQLLYAMLSPQLDPRRLSRRDALAPRRVSPAEAALVTAVLGTGAAQRELLPALMAAYHHADHVYDKFHMRSLIDGLLMELWRDPACARSLTDVAQAQARACGAACVWRACGARALGGPDFPDFVGSVLNDLIYLLEDSLARLQSTTRGFMRMALSTLQMLITLVDNRAVHAAFMREDVVHKAANAVGEGRWDGPSRAAVKFLDILQGTQAQQLHVERPEQYGFSPDQLLVQMLSFTLRLAEQPAFVAAVAGAPDYEEGVMRAVLDALSTRQLGEYEHQRRLRALVDGVRRARGGAAAGEAEGEVGPGGAGGGGAPAPLDLSFAAAEPADLEAAYVAALEPLAVGDFDAGGARAYKREFAARAAAPAGPAPARAKALAREYRNLSVDALDKARALITGPEGTPYYGGCFVFDVWRVVVVMVGVGVGGFPPTYPEQPPLMELETTGGGVARFNPNL